MPKQIKAKLYSPTGQRKILGIACPDDGRMIPAEACRIACCSCCNGYKEVKTESGIEITTMCGWGEKV